MPGLQNIVCSRAMSDLDDDYNDLELDEVGSLDDNDVESDDVELADWDEA